jgi:hypothetical protein
MEHQAEKRKLGKDVVTQKKLIQSLEKITLNLINILNEDQWVDNFTLEQRESLIESIKLSETVDGPIGAAEKLALTELQEKLEKLITKRMEDQKNRIVDFTSKTKDLKKYNLKNVR